MSKKCAHCGYDVSGLPMDRPCPERGSFDSILDDPKRGTRPNPRHRDLAHAISLTVVFLLIAGYTVFGVGYTLTYGGYSGSVIGFAIGVALHALLPCVFAVIMIRAWRRCVRDWSLPSGAREHS